MASGFNGAEGVSLDIASVRVLVVDDYEPWRRFYSTTFQKRPDLRVISEASDGLEAVQQAQQLQPDLILLDIGLPSVNGIEAARRIRDVSPTSKILFVSENRSNDIVKEALSTGAGGYIVKSDAGSELLPAVEAVLESKRFISPSVTGRDLNVPKDDNAATTHCHEVAFYPDDASVVDGYARFIESALKSGNAVIVVATDAHRASLLPRLEADGVNVACRHRTWELYPVGPRRHTIKIDSQRVNGTLNPVRCKQVIGDLIMGAAKGVKGEHGRVVVCGEIAPTLLSKGNAEGAIKLEHLWDEITKGYGVHTLCGYLSSAFPNKENNPIFERICAEHSAVHGLGY